MIREHVVKSLIDAATSGMESVAAQASHDEVLSAFMTMARNSVLAAKSMGAPSSGLRIAAMSILMACGDDGRVM